MSYKVAIKTLPYESCAYSINKNVMTLYKIYTNKECNTY